MRADILSKLASTKAPGNHRSVLQEVLSSPSVPLDIEVQALSVMTVEASKNWITPILQYILNGQEPADEKEAMAVRRRATSYSVIEGKLFRRGFSMPLLKCVEGSEADYVLAEIHEGICGQHLGGRALAAKALRAGYYWPTMNEDAQNYVKKCEKCQKYADVHLAPSSDLKYLSSPWACGWWGIDLLGPFHPGPGQVKYLIVAVDYSTKWIEAEPLAKITAKNCIKFFKRNIMTRFGIPEVVITDNGTQFADKGFRELMKDLGIKHRFTSVEHPQTNGQAEAANRVILRGLRRRLDESKGCWPEELPYVLWAYRTTPHSSTGESPFRLAYGSEAVIPVEIGELSWRTENPNSQETNDKRLREELDFLEEVRNQAALKDSVIKQKMAMRYNAKVVRRTFSVGDLVLRRADVGLKNAKQGKLAPNWEGPYRVAAETQMGAFKLETLSGEVLPRTWSADKIRAFNV